MDDLRKGFNEQWRTLCEEFTIARDAFYNAASVVERRFATTGDPTQEEIDVLDAAEAQWKDVERRMDEATEKWMADLRKKR